MVTIPTIHLNGSAKAELLARLRTAIEYIAAAIDAVRQTAPNGRDYYLQGDAAFQEARDTFHLRLGKLSEVKGELTEIALGIIPQGRNAGEGGEMFEPAPAASIWRPMSDAPTDGTPILAKIRDGIMIPVDGVDQLFWWSGKCGVVVAIEREGQTRWKLNAMDSWEEFSEHEIEGWTPLPGDEIAEAGKGGAQ